MTTRILAHSILMAPDPSFANEGSGTISIIETMNWF